MTRLMLFVAGLLALADAGPAGAALCRTTGGLLVLRDRCTKTERPVDPSAMPFKGDTGDKGAQGDPGPRGTWLHVVDSAGKDVGAVVETHGSSEKVLAQIGTNFYFFSVDRNGLLSDPTPPSFRYQDAACAGPPQYRYDGYRFSTDCIVASRDSNLAFTLMVDDAKTTGYFVRQNEVAASLMTHDFYTRDISTGHDANEATSYCSTVLGSPAPCAFDASLVCVLCCIHSYEDSNSCLRPLHAVDLSGLGVTPPFAYQP